MTNDKMQKLALFDFDGTLTRKDTLFEIIIYIHGRRRFYLGMIYLLPFILLYKIKFLKNWQVKQKCLVYFFAGMPYDYFQAKCERFSTERLPYLLRNDAMKTFNKLKNGGVRTIIVTASAENWVKPWCDVQNTECIATKLEIKEGKLTGMINGENCHGIEKVLRIKNTVNLSQYSSIEAYGDSSGDIPMLALATKPHYKKFHS